MKLKFSILLLLIVTAICAQTHRFIYEFKYKPVSLSDNMHTEKMILDITGDQVQFYEYKALRIDSLNKKGGGISQYTFPHPKLKRTLAASKNLNYYLISDSYFVYPSNDSIQWQIHPETKTYNQWQLQKATANFRGRNWEVWFSTDIPFFEGPYKFTGLPGLVVEAKDSQNNFSYQLAKIEKPITANHNIVETVFAKKPLPITFEKYKELMLANYNDPYSRFRNMQPGSWMIEHNGKIIDDIEGLSQITRNEQASLRRNHNPIELENALKYPEK